MTFLCYHHKNRGTHCTARKEGDSYRCRPGEGLPDYFVDTDQFEEFFYEGRCEHSVEHTITKGQPSNDGDEVYKGIAKCFSAAKTLRGTSVRKLADAMETSASQAQRLLSGCPTHSPTIKSLCRAAKALGIRMQISFVVDDRDQIR